MRLLLNAEPFGFGPAAAVAALCRELACRDVHVDYAGQGHTLDLQRGLPYRKVHDTRGMGDDDLSGLLGTYPCVLTAMDWHVAMLALGAGCRVAVYDALAWFWNPIPPVALGCLHLVQDFPGVREQVIKQSPGAVVVPPLCTRQFTMGPRDSDLVLLNLGGLESPDLPAVAAARYASCVGRAVSSSLPAGTQVEIACSDDVALLSGLPRAGSRSLEEMSSLMSRASVAVMTPGLGNIHDAAAHGLPVAWLPPTNASQDQQLCLLLREGMCDAAIGWEDIMPAGVTITCRGPGGPGSIMAAIHAMEAPSVGACIGRALSRAMGHLSTDGGSKAGLLLDRYGSGGAPVAAGHLVDWLQCDHA